MKITFIVPYFGNLPNYFQLFLDSCSYNSDFDWLIFSNDQTGYIYPENVHLIPMTFEECREHVQRKFDFTITLHTPQKLCDYKCAYGYIFSEYLDDSSWWGYCDLDQVFGNLGAFITDEMLEKYDRIGSLGHLTLCRNTPDNNRVFMHESRYREVFTTERGCGFDEWLPDNINEIFLRSGRPVLLENYGADINAYRTTLQTVHYDADAGCYRMSPVTNSVFCWEHGTVTQVWKESNFLCRKEYPYVHLQKRTMEDQRTDRTSKLYWIVPNQFVDDADPAVLLKQAKHRGMFNTQFIQVKWKSLKYRLKSGDWKFSNVFQK